MSGKEECASEAPHGVKRPRVDDNEQEKVKRAREEEGLYDEFFDEFFEALPAYMWYASYWIALSKCAWLLE